ncbi:MAG TPA: nucleoside-diphosphate kinase [Moorella mulderi]|nr:nucleoside-diphosphate kinase [Moorella mulderi]
METTLVLIKPEGVARGLVGEIISRFERKGYELVGLKLLRLTQEKAEELYGEHRGKPFYPELIGHMTSGKVVAMVWRGPGAISGARKIIGPTDPREAPPGTIRGDLVLEVGANLVHGSDSLASAQREISIFFQKGEMEG